MATRTQSSRPSGARQTRAAARQRPQCHFISNTHWDREWVYSMQRTRFNLVQMMDVVLDLFEKERGFKHFHLDSQTVPLLDYLEIRPERAPLIRRLVEAGKLAIGPWFTLPDEFCISGESIIRNLLVGHGIAARFGGVSKTGYSPFSWGQCSQMPQIYKGFGIDMIMFYRGVNTLVAPKAEFIWRGADGTEIVASRLGRRPRYNVWYVLQRPAYWGYSLDELNRFESRWSNGHGAFRLASGEFATLDYQTAHPRYAYDAAVMPEAARTALREQDADWSTPHRFWSAGHDSSFPDAREVRMVADARAALRHEADVFWSTVKAFQDGVLARRSQHWPIVTGEMRHPGTRGSTSPLIGGIISARTYLKQDNHATEQLLTRLAEPLAVFAAMLGAPYPRAFVDQAYRYLLENHAHDSIGGCGRDIVAQDMLDRSRQCREIATCVLESALREIAGTINLKTAMREITGAIDFAGEGTAASRRAGTRGTETDPRPDRKGGHDPRPDRKGGRIQNPDRKGGHDPRPDRKGGRIQNPDRKGGADNPIALVSHRRPTGGRTASDAGTRPAPGPSPLCASRNDVALVVFNPSPFARSEVTTVTLDTPRDWPQEGIEIIDDAGHPIEFQLVNGPIVNTERVFNPNDVFNYLSMNRRELHIAARDVPAMGYRTYLVRPSRPARAPRVSLLTGPRAMQNEFLSCEVDRSGRLSLAAEDLGRRLTGLGYFVDSGAAGNPWIHESPLRDAIFTTADCGTARVTCVQDGPLAAVLRVQIPWRLPESLAPDGQSRSGRLVAYPIANLLTLRRGQPWIEIVTEIDNTARDHRLRVSFPTCAWHKPGGGRPGPPEKVAVQTPFDVVERPFGVPDPARYEEAPQDEQPMQSFIDATDGKVGVAILADGLRAYTADRDEARTISLTLLRAFAMKFFVPEKHDHLELSAGSQCPGRHRFRYAIYPHKGDWRTGDVWQAAERFTTPLVAAQIAPTRHGSQPMTRSFLEIKPASLHLGAVKQSEDGRGWVVRVFNPGDERVDASIRLNGGFAPPRGDCSPTRRVKDEFALPDQPGPRWGGVELVTLEERPIRRLTIGPDGGVRVQIDPRQIATLRFCGQGVSGPRSSTPRGRALAARSRSSSAIA